MKTTTLTIATIIIAANAILSIAYVSHTYEQLLQSRKAQHRIVRDIVLRENNLLRSVVVKPMSL